MNEVRVLECLTDLDGGGIERFVYDCCVRLKPEVQMDFAVFDKRGGILEEPLRRLGCNIYHLPNRHESLTRYLRQLEKIMRDGRYDVVHDHGGYMAAISLYVAKKCGVKGRIAHAHGAFIPLTPVEKVERKIFTPITKLLATELLACGEDAGNWMWGRARGHDSILYCGIEPARFAYRPGVRAQLREQLGLEDRFVIGNVARLSYQKNHEYLLRVFSEVTHIRDDAVLLLVGRGELEEDIRRQTSELGLEDCVRFLGVRNDVAALLNAFDVFLLPSRYEGLPISLLEAQANGLPIFTSTAVSRETSICGGVVYLPLDAEPAEWAERICADARRADVNPVVGTGFDIDVAAKRLGMRFFSYV